MIVVTAMLLFAMLIFAPIRFRVDGFIYLQRLSVDISAKVGVFGVFDENVSLRGKYLHCEGTVAADVDLQTMDKQSHIDLLKCITVDKLCMALYNNILNVSMYYVAMENAVLALVTATLCNLFHCQFYTQVLGTLEESMIHVEVVASTSVAELSFCLAKQGVRQWKIRKSGKS